ncbi:MAG: tetratricopeptide repeat protein [Pseudomonadota bacterium]
MTNAARQTSFANPSLALALAVAFTAGSFSLPAYAASDSGSSTTPTCKKSMVWDKRKRKCVKAQRSSNLSDQNIYEGAVDLAYNGRYAETLDLLALAKNQNDARILNYRGFATRKLGRVEEALGYYRAALAIDPDYTLVMSYMGEAFLQQGKVDEARDQLAAIKAQCGTGCREYALLDDAITAYVTR